MATRFIIPALISTAVIGALAYSPHGEITKDTKLAKVEVLELDFGKLIEVPPEPLTKDDDGDRVDIPDVKPMPTLIPVVEARMDEGMRQYTPTVLTPNIKGVGMMVISTGDPGGAGLRDSNGNRPAFTWGDLDNKPKTLFQAAPEYPAEAKVKGLPGEVVVTFNVDEKGYVHNVQVVRSSSFEFEEPTIRAVSKWRFEPGRKNGRSVSFKMSVPVAFNINEEI